MLSVMMLSMIGGCEVAGWLAHGVAGGPPKINVKAEYTALDNQAVAVLVDADMKTLYRQPQARYEICAVMSERIAANVPGVTVLDAKQVVDFQNRNIYWNTSAYSELAKRLGVTRLVIVDLIDYRLHEPGNVNIWRGLISANLGVAETDGSKPNDLAYQSVVQATYPPDNKVGVVNADARTIRLGTLDLFSRAAAGKFYDHREER